MSPLATSVRLGFARGWIETKKSMTNAQDASWYVVFSIAFLIVLIFQRDSDIEGTSLAALTLPSLLGMSVATGGLTSVAGLLSFDREDGTLLRAKAVPNGMVGYLVSRIVMIVLTTLFGMALSVVPALFFVDGLVSAGVSGWLTAVWVFALGMLATASWGAIIGSLVKNAASGFMLTFLPVSGIVAISGIFYPISGLPEWLQSVGQVFPVYWLGLGMRSALLPDSAAAAELGDSWRHWETAGVLGLWAVIGLAVAPAVLRRMARRESGSTMEFRKQRAIHRGY